MKNIHFKNKYFKRNYNNIQDLIEVYYNILYVGTMNKVDKNKKWLVFEKPRQRNNIIALIQITNKWNERRINISVKQPPREHTWKSILMALDHLYFINNLYY